MFSFKISVFSQGKKKVIKLQQISNQRACWTTAPSPSFPQENGPLIKGKCVKMYNQCTGKYIQNNTLQRNMKLGNSVSQKVDVLLVSLVRLK